MPSDKRRGATLPPFATSSGGLPNGHVSFHVVFVPIENLKFQPPIQHLNKPYPPSPSIHNVARPERLRNPDRLTSFDEQPGQLLRLRLPFPVDQCCHILRDAAVQNTMVFLELFPPFSRLLRTRPWRRFTPPDLSFPVRPNLQHIPLKGCTHCAIRIGPRPGSAVPVLP